MRKRLFLLLQFIITSIYAADVPGKFPKGDFIPPFAGEIEVIGTFCELRPNHFHGGLDIRTGGKTGRPVLAIGDGYIARINISTTGYGYALYIAHPNGYTSVYAHLSDFPESVKWYIRKNQYLEKSFEVELHPEPGVLQVRKGQVVAYSGNTGSSSGPHLHFEIRETDTEAPVNPLLCGIRMKDFMAPAILGLFVYRRDSLEKIHNGHYPSVSLPLYTRGTSKKGRRTTIPVRVHTLQPGIYALGATLRDYAISKGNNNGVNYIQIYRDDKLIYDCRIERFLFSHMRMHNNYVDYRRYKKSGVLMHKLFRDDGSTLQFWETSPGDGWFEVTDSSELDFRIVVSDVYGHKSERNITVRGSDEGRSVRDYIRYERNSVVCHAAKGATIEVSPEFRVIIPPNALFSDYHVTCRKNFGHNYDIGDNLVSLNSRIELRFRLHSTQMPFADKFTVCSRDGRKYGAVLKEGNWLCAEVRDFGNYFLILDTFPPSVTPVYVNKNSYFAFTVRDGSSGFKKHDFYINGVWVLLEYDPKTARISGRIPNPLPDGRNKIELVVSDARLNERKYSRIINIP